MHPACRGRHAFAIVVQRPTGGDGSGQLGGVRVFQPANGRIDYGDLVPAQFNPVGLNLSAERRHVH
jgi:hypothetical protein